MMHMHMNQIAFYCATDEAERQVKDSFGLHDKDWIKDTVYSDVLVWGMKGKNVAELQFNYDMGCEFEIIRYVEGPHWMQHIVTPKPFLAHIGIHLPDHLTTWPAVDPSWQLAQQAETYKHTAPHLNTGYAAGRLYSYRIYEVSQHSFVKFIRRRNA